MNILIIEDDPIISTLIKNICEKKGHQADVCATAEDGQTRWLEKKHPLILLDLNLPGMNGVEFCQWLRGDQKQEDPFILISTSNNKVETFHKVLEAGANDYIPKPLQPMILAIRIDVAQNQIKQIAKKRAYENQILQNEKRFRLISEHSRDLVSTHKANGEIIYISPSIKNLLGLEPEQLLGKTFNDIKIQTADNPLNLDVGKAEDNGRFESTQTWKAQHANGKTVWLETYTQTVRNEQNAVQEIYSYSRDVSEEKNEEQQLKILNILGESKDSEAFLKDIIQEIRNTFSSEACIHIRSASPDTLSYCIYQKDIKPEVLKLHRQLCKETDQNIPQFQGQNARGVFHHLEGIEPIEAVITHPIPGTFGKPIGKITITSYEKINYSERTKAVLSVLSSKVGCVLEEHITRK
jgi:PAS domain S-box-containing protein